MTWRWTGAVIRSSTQSDGYDGSAKPAALATPSPVYARSTSSLKQAKCTVISDPASAAKSRAVRTAISVAAWNG
jgi:hypothetical protein